MRFDREVNPHIAFGGGIHRCLGSHLARLELRVALREWHQRIPEYEVEPGHTLVYTPGIRSIDHFPMRFTRAGVVASRAASAAVADVLGPAAVVPVAPLVATRGVRVPA